MSRVKPPPTPPTPPTQRSPQLGRIARLLKVEPEKVTGLDGVGDDDLRAFHDQIAGVLFSDGEHRFARIAGLSKALPGPVAGKLAERFLPAEMAARVAVLLEPSRARDLVGRVSVPYLGDISLALDPVRSKPVVQQIPAKRVGEVARELFGRGEYAAMAEFVGTVTLEALHAALIVASGRDLLKVVPLLEWNHNLDRVIAELPAAQVNRIVAELDPAELAELAMALDPSRFGPIVSAVPVETVAEIARVLFERGEYEGMARFVGVVTVEALHAALNVASGHDLLAVVPLLEWNDSLDSVIAELDQAQIDRIVVELDVTELAGLALALDPSRFGPIVGAVSPETVAGIASVLFERGEYDAMARFVGVVTAEMLHAALGAASGHDLLRVMPLVEWNETVELVVDEISDQVLDRLLAEIAAGEAWSQAHPTLERVGPRARERLLERIGHLPAEQRQAIRRAAADGDLGPSAAALLSGAPPA